MELVLAKSQDAIVLTSISKRAFNSDIGVGGTQAGGPPGYQSHKFYMKNIQSQKKRYISRLEKMSLSTGSFLDTPMFCQYISIFSLSGLTHVL